MATAIWNEAEINHWQKLPLTPLRMLTAEYPWIYGERKLSILGAKSIGLFVVILSQMAFMDYLKIIA